jgi:hypothetical protein
MIDAIRLGGEMELGFGEAPAQKRKGADVRNDKCVEGVLGQVIKVGLQLSKVLIVEIYVQGGIELFIALDTGYFPPVFVVEIIRLGSKTEISQTDIRRVCAVGVDRL